jgi:hypothetical protein
MSTCPKSVSTTISRCCRASIKQAPVIRPSAESAQCLGSHSQTTAERAVSDTGRVPHLAVSRPVET